MPKKCCVVGFPVGHSLSPAMHNAAFKHLGLDFVYEACEVDPRNFVDFMDRVIDGEFHGVSVTVPFKQTVMDYVNVLSPCAKSIDAVNTLFFDGKTLVGENTDWFGIYMILKELVRFKRRRILIYGAGGAARSALYAAKDLDLDIFLTNRTKSKGEKLAKDFDVKYCDPINLPEVDVFVNATSIGLSGQNFLPVSEKWLRRVESVFDMVYTGTILEQTAKKIGCKVISGKKMLLYQGAKQFEIWTGEAAPIRVMEKAIGL